MMRSLKTFSNNNIYKAKHEHIQQIGCLPQEHGFASFLEPVNLQQGLIEIAKNHGVRLSDRWISGADIFGGIIGFIPQIREKNIYVNLTLEVAASGQNYL